MNTYTLDTVLHDLPDTVIDRCDGELYEAVKAAGYQVGVRQLINQWNCWHYQVGAFLRQLAGHPK